MRDDVIPYGVYATLMQALDWYEEDRKECAKYGGEDAAIEYEVRADIEEAREWLRNA